MGLTRLEKHMETFALYSVLYYDGTLNPYSMRSWEDRVADRLPECQEGITYWIANRGTRTGGVILEANRISRFFMIPPNDREDLALQWVTDALQDCSDPERPIRASWVLPHQLEAFREVGFLPP
jgi:hypothetical protein